MPVYLDCNATTPLEPEVSRVVRTYMETEYGNSGSRTHGHGTRARQAVEVARRSVAALVDAQVDEVTFTSGATESNNLALLGLAEAAHAAGRRHVLVTSIEHKAVLAPCEELARRGFEVEQVPVGSSGRVDVGDVLARTRSDTWLVSVMHVNNETGVRQPLGELCLGWGEHPWFLHCDAAQGYGKDLAPLRSPRIDLISVSGHKIYGPKGVGALIARRRGFARPPLRPLFFGGGQERGLRPGTLPVPLIAGLGCASDLASRFSASRRQRCSEIRRRATDALSPLAPVLIGDQEYCEPHVLSLSFPGLDSEAVMLVLKDVIEVSNGSACTSASYEPSHVLTAMHLDAPVISGALRISWSHMSEEPDWGEVASRIASLLAPPAGARPVHGPK